MSKREDIHKELAALNGEGTNLLALQQKPEPQFLIAYQRWYTKALKVVASLAPDRYAEFRSYYEVDPKRKSLGYETYVIQDFFRGVAPNSHNYPHFDEQAQVLTCLVNQLTILSSLQERVDSVLANIEGELYAELQDNELALARQLAKVNLRAAGALVGVVIEGHLQKVASSHGIEITKKNPTIADLNDPLKAAFVIDTPTWRKISFLGDLRNLCCHKRDAEPSATQVEELMQGAEWLTKNVF
jgi:hypothetical protein